MTPLIIAMVFPSLETWLCFVALAGHPAMRIAYGLCKLLQFGFPLVWAVGVERARLRPVRPDGRGLGAGLAFGAAVSGGLLAMYFGALKGSPLLAGVGPAVLAKLQQIGAATPLRFLALALFYSLAHSLLEELYWRWFVFGRLRSLLPAWFAFVLSSLTFMAHHVILIGVYARGAGWVIILLSGAVAAGGAVWAWIYNRTGSLYGPWLSHMLVDAAIMVVGYDLIWGRPS